MLRKVTIVCLIIFSSLAPAGAETLYVRPASGGEYGTEDGLSFDTAFDGWADIVWGTGAGQVGPGDTLYVCDKHVVGTTTSSGFLDWPSTTALYVGASGTAGNPITIRGDYPGHQGALICARRQTYDQFVNTWTGHSSPTGIWRAPTSSLGSPAVAFLGEPESDPDDLMTFLGRTPMTVTKAAATIEINSGTGNIVVTPGGTVTSFTTKSLATIKTSLQGLGCTVSEIRYVDSITLGTCLADVTAGTSIDTGLSLSFSTAGYVTAVETNDGSEANDGSYIYVNPPGSPGTFTQNFYGVVWTCLALDGASHITLRNLYLAGGKGADGVLRITDDVDGTTGSNISIYNCDIGFGSFTGIFAQKSTDYVLVEDCKLHDFPSGTYTYQTGGYHHDYWTFRRCEVTCKWQHLWDSQLYGDVHAIGGQAMSHLLIEHCNIHDWPGDGIINYCGVNSNGQDVIIRYNYIYNLNDINHNNHHYGIARNGSNGVDWTTRMSGWQIYCNIIGNLGPGPGSISVYGDGSAFRNKGGGGTYDQWPKIWGNVIFDCQVGFWWMFNPDLPGGGWDWHDNIVLCPKPGGWHVYMASTSTGRLCGMENNCWYPDTKGTDNKFMWFGSTATDFADFAAKAAADSVTVTGSIVLTPDAAAAVGATWQSRTRPQGW